MITDFDIFSDFYADPQIRTLFSSEYESIPSQYMWALLLYCHPKSKFYALDSANKAALIARDYLNVESFPFEEYEATIQKILSSPLITTKPQRLLANWERKLEERDAFLASQPYNESTYDMLDKMMKETHKMWQNYKVIYDDFLKEEDIKTQGAIQESLSEQGLI